MLLVIVVICCLVSLGIMTEPLGAVQVICIGIDRLYVSYIACLFMKGPCLPVHVTVSDSVDCIYLYLSVLDIARMLVSGTFIKSGP